MMAERPEKYCAVCGRRMVWRRRWRRNWENVRYCSRACRHRGLSDLDRRLEAVILELLRMRGAHKTICPSEAAQIVAGRRSANDWRALMPAARKAARRLVAKDRVDILQKGHVVDASTARGAIRVRLRTET
ncbi:MAG: DUF3253 domain-containing protein [Desulfobacterales bacterium]|nr:DUF3253 domain-containing protein [Desulfobacterales bacterium]